MYDRFLFCFIYLFQEMRRGRAVRAPDLQSEGPRSIVLSCPEFNSSAALINSELSCSVEFGLFRSPSFGWSVVKTSLV